LEAARIINFLCESDIRGEIINFGGRERLSRYEFAIKFCKLRGFNVDLLGKTSMYDFHDLPHVADVSMNVDKLLSYGYKLKSVDESLAEIFINGKT
jgi:dTDP-4-dehydrorhamnose reductase